MNGAPNEIPLSLCRLNPAARDIRPIHVEMLARSIADVGLIQPIVVRRVNDGFEIIAGAHRVEAFRLLGRDLISALVRSDDDLHAELAMIDENLIRNELSPAERAIAISRRKAIYEALHPETAAGVAGGKARQGSASDNLSFAESTAHATGKNRRTVERDARRGSALGDETLKAITGTILDEGEELDALAKLLPERRDALIERVAAGEDVSARTEFSRQRRAGRIDEIAKAGPIAPLPTGRKFNIIYADPPWRFDVWSQETGLEKSPENHYPTMTVEEICALPVGDMVAADALLFMWITSPRLFRAEEIFRAWGPVDCDDPIYGSIRKPWVYVSHYVWDKERIATGYWNRNRHEILLIAKIGDMPRPLPDELVASVYREASTVHSAKPRFFAELIEKHYPVVAKIELFRRGPQRPGWDAWGNEAERIPERAMTEERLGPLSPSIDSDPETGELTETAEDSPTVPVSEPACVDSSSLNPPAHAGSLKDEEALDIPDFLRRDEHNHSPFMRPRG